MCHLNDPFAFGWFFGNIFDPSWKRKVKVSNSRLKRFTQGGNCFHIQVICRFVQNEQVRTGRRKPSKGHPGLLPSGQNVHLSRCQVASTAESSKNSSKNRLVKILFNFLCFGSYLYSSAVLPGLCFCIISIALRLKSKSKNILFESIF